MSRSGLRTPSPKRLRANAQGEKEEKVNRGLDLHEKVVNWLSATVRTLGSRVAQLETANYVTKEEIGSVFGDVVSSNGLLRKADVGNFVTREEIGTVFSNVISSSRFSVDILRF